MEKEKIHRIVWATLITVFLAFLVFRRGRFFLLPLLVFLPFWFWGRGTGGAPGMGGEDPADGWKRGKEE